MTYKSLLLAGAVTCLITASSASARVVFDINQVGSSVIASASGSFDRTGTSIQFTNSTVPSFVRGTPGFLSVGLTEQSTLYNMVDIGSETIGPSRNFIASSSQEGLSVGFNRSSVAPYFFISDSYVDNSAISGSATWLNSTIASLGLAPGTYVSTVGANIITVNISPVTGAVPEPATWAMMMLGFGGMGYAMRRKNKVAARIKFA